MKFRQLNSKENKLHFGPYPDVSLSDARAKRDSAGKLLAAGVDPGQARDDVARRTKAIAENTFEKVARDWHRTNLKKCQPQTAENILHRFEVDLFPHFGTFPMLISAHLQPAASTLRSGCR
ncbi:hypothetical protein CR105_27425 [Massilia eurypsychrophila]|uniref:Integrase DNA-binding domain-containing protein n=1 Tax=Massilia eurypsychrophila TaxID=1485217 RepID=A0A2G8T741_9BURK|nr:hypothetical protein CR105_27425 [Massilia eurypsychrophila]